MKKISKSSLNNKEYEIPSTLDDTNGINDFLDLNKDKKVIVVQGLGFVGAVMSIVCANALNEEYAVIGIDLPTSSAYWKIKSINEGVFPVISADKKVESYFQTSIKKKNFYATYDPYAFSKADFIIVDINLDVQKSSSHIDHDTDIRYDVDIEPFKLAIKSIGDNCRNDALILIETTVPPGSTKMAYKIIKNSLNARGISGDEIKMGHSYERVMPGPNYIDSIQNFYRVYSGVNDESANAIEIFLKTIIKTDEYPLTRLKNTNSTEMSKVLENSYRAMNIAFIVEWSRFAEESSVDLYEVINAIRMRPTHKNIMLPGIGVGGYCLTKDPLLASWSKQNLASHTNELSLSESAVRINDNMPKFVFNFLKNSYKKTLKNKKIALLGVSYAPDIGDTRFSPVNLFFKLLKKDGADISAHDPYINLWEEYNRSVHNDISFLKEEYDIIVFSTGHTFYKNNMELRDIINSKKDLYILDTIGLLNEEEIKEYRKKHKVMVIGRGDL